MSQETWANIVYDTERMGVSDQSQIPDQKIFKIINIGKSYYAIGTVIFLLSCPPIVVFLKFCYAQPNTSDIVKALHTFLLLKKKTLGPLNTYYKLYQVIILQILQDHNSKMQQSL